MTATEIPLAIVATCDECNRLRAELGLGPITELPRPGQRGAILLEMNPRLDDQPPGPHDRPWYLCARHWLEGIKPGAAVMQTRVLETPDPAEPKRRVRGRARADP